MKKLLFLSLALLFAVALYGVTQGVQIMPYVVIGFVLAGLVKTSKPVLNAVYVSAFPCALGTLTSSEDCNTRGGMRRGYWAKYTEIDWATMAGSTTNFDTATQKIKAFVMLSSAKFKKVSHDKKQGQYSAIYEQANGYYTVLLNLFFLGKSAANRLTFQSAVSCCNIVYITAGNDGSLRIFGVEWDGSAFDTPLTPLKIGRHGDFSGSFTGNDAGRDEVDLAGEQLYAPLYLDMLESAIPV